MESSGMVSVIITVSDQAISRIDQLTQQLKRKGLDVTNVLPRLGVIAGNARNISDLQEVEGVQSVEREYNSMLPPRYSPIQ